MNEKTRDPDDEHTAPEAEPKAAGEPLATPVGSEPVREHAAKGPEATPPVDDTADEAEYRPTAAPAGRGPGTALALFALLLALISLAAAGYLWWSGRDSGTAGAESAAAIDRLSGTLESAQGSLQDFGNRIGELENSRDRIGELEDLDERVGELDAADADQARELAALAAELEEFRNRSASLPGRLSRLESALALLQGISAGSRDTWLLAEAEYYLQLANAELQLAGHPERALLALRFADRRLRELANPALAGVRRALAQELRAVEAMEQPDIEGLSMTLASLAETVDALPLARDAAEPDRGREELPEDMGAFDRALASVQSAFSDIVTVRRTDEAVTPLLSPEAAHFLRANLALRLQTARLALLRGEQAIFEQSLADAAAWLREYYDADSGAVQSALETLSGLRAAEFTLTPPDISDSLRLLREFRQRHAAGVPEAPADETASPADNPAPPADEPASSADNPAVPADEPVSPADNPAVPADEPVSPADNPATPADEPVSPADNPAVPADEPAQ